MKIFSEYFVTIFKVGLLPFAPGTLGSLIAILIWYVSIYFLSIYLFYIIVILTLILSFSTINNYLNEKKKDDPSDLIIDEFLGQSIPLFFIFEFYVFELLLVFVAFRFFDIFKIYPVNKAENLEGSFGVIMDDVVAGVYALIILMIYKIVLLI